MGALSRAIAPGRLRPVGYAYVIAQLIPPGILLVFLVGSLILSGGQVAPGAPANWDVVVPFPLFPVPGWLLGGLGAVALALAIAWAWASTAAEAAALSGALGVTMASSVASLFFALVFAGDPLGGFHWIGMVLALLSAAVLLITSFARTRRDGAGHDLSTERADA